MTIFHHLIVSFHFVYQASLPILFSKFYNSTLSNKSIVYTLYFGGNYLPSLLVILVSQLYWKSLNRIIPFPTSRNIRMSPSQKSNSIFFLPFPEKDSIMLPSKNTWTVPEVAQFPNSKVAEPYPFRIVLISPLVSSSLEPFQPNWNSFWINTEKY